MVNGTEYSRREVGVTQDLWDTINVGSKLPVVYLPTVPRLSRLTKGARGDNDAFGFMVIGLIGTVFFGSFFLMSRLGFDIITNSSKPSHIGKYYLFRHGKLIKVFRIP